MCVYVCVRVCVCWCHRRCCCCLAWRPSVCHLTPLGGARVSFLCTHRVVSRTTTTQRIVTVVTATTAPTATPTATPTVSTAPPTVDPVARGWWTTRGHMEPPPVQLCYATTSATRPWQCAHGRQATNQHKHKHANDAHVEEVTSSRAQVGVWPPTTIEIASRWCA